MTRGRTEGGGPPSKIVHPSKIARWCRSAITGEHLKRMPRPERRPPAIAIGGARTTCWSGRQLSVTPRKEKQGTDWHMPDQALSQCRWTLVLRLRLPVIG